jgi:hypothetical protein
MGVDPTITAAIIALVGVIISALTSAFVSKWISGRTLYINSVTVERSKWIDKLRENIAKCSGDLRSLSYKVEAAYARISVAPVRLQEQDELVEKINMLISLISLQLNPFGEIDKNILAILARMPTLAQSPDGRKLRVADELLIKHSQWLLKAEWEKVKSETKGIILRVWAAMNAHRHLCRYRAFCEGEGSLAKLD